MMEGVSGLPPGATILFTTGLGDLVFHVTGLYLVVKSRYGAIDIVEGFTFASLVALTQDPAQRDAAWEWQPYPLYEHLAIIAQMAGQPAVRRHLLTAPPPPVADPYDRLVEVGRELMAQLTDSAAITVSPLPDSLGVRVVHAVRGGAAIYVAPDESVLFTGSAVSPDVALEAFRTGARTPKEKFRRADPAAR
jgi:hypothetical protein